jgi:hypothetical protein
MCNEQSTQQGSESVRATALEIMRNELRESIALHPAVCRLSYQRYFAGGSAREQIDAGTLQATRH